MVALAMGASVLRWPLIFPVALAAPLRARAPAGPAE
jgi:hypothetical protein